MTSNRRRCSEKAVSMCLILSQINTDSVNKFLVFGGRLFTVRVSFKYHYKHVISDSFMDFFVLNAENLSRWLDNATRGTVSFIACRVGPLPRSLPRYTAPSLKAASTHIIRGFKGTKKRMIYGKERRKLEVRIQWVRLWAGSRTRQTIEQIWINMGRWECGSYSISQECTLVVFWLKLLRKKDGWFECRTKTAANFTTIVQTESRRWLFTCDIRKSKIPEEGDVNTLLGNMQDVSNMWKEREKNVDPTKSREMLFVVWQRPAGVLPVFKRAAWVLIGRNLRLRHTDHAYRVRFKDGKQNRLRAHQIQMKHCVNLRREPSERA